MIAGIARGLLAGAAGTAALNVLTYLDMVVRARPSSPVPKQTAQELADSLDTDLAPDGREETRNNRGEGLGALMGLASGLGFGALYGLAADSRRPSVPLGAAGLALAAMAGANAPAAATGVTEPQEWSPQAWAADIVPHLAYGLVTAAVFDSVDLRGGEDHVGSSGL